MEVKCDNENGKQAPAKNILANINRHIIFLERKNKNSRQAEKNKPSYEMCKKNIFSFFYHAAQSKVEKRKDKLLIDETGFYEDEAGFKRVARDKNLRPCLPLKPQEKI